MGSRIDRTRSQIRHAFALGVATASLVAGCVAGSGAPTTPSAGAGQTIAAVEPTASMSAVPAESVKELPTEDVPADPPASCPVSQPPDRPFVPPEPYRRTPPAYYQEAWYGSDRLWTTIRLDGENWRSLPYYGGAFSQKTFWWSKDFDISKEHQPKIKVAGRRLDVTGPTFSAGNPGTNGWKGFDDIGEFMLVGIDVPTPGCWEITATYRAATLSIVVWIDND